MNIAFRTKGIKGNLVENTEVEIVDKDNGTIIGRIFSPAGTMDDVPNAIQICGFDVAYCLWGCGVIEGEDKLMKKDIQLLFQPRKTDAKISAKDFECWKCFNSKGDCSCEELKVFNQIEDVEEFMAKREIKRFGKKVADSL